MDNFNMMGGGGNPSGGKKAVHVKVRHFCMEGRCTKSVYQDFYYDYGW